MTLDKYSKGIAKTGFLLEAQTVEAFRSAGWSVISNKYYLDEDQQLVREIDLVAYKVSKIDVFHQYTCVLISCKKSEKSIWAFLTRERPTIDPNVDWQPMHIWTNVSALKFFTGRPTWRRQYYDSASVTGAARLLEDPTTHVFAFQELDRQTGSPQNDKPIFQSVTSLMKAQAYELSSLPTRKTGGQYFYQFNLLSVAETDLISLHCKSEGIEASAVKDVHYLSSYIIKRVDTNARIYVIDSSVLEATVRAYDGLHVHNVNFFASEFASFYSNAFQDNEKRDFLEKDAAAKIGTTLRLYFIVHHPSPPPVNLVYLSWDQQQEIAVIDVDLPDEDIAALNSHRDTVAKVKKILASMFRYEGAFEFRKLEDIPF